MSLSEYRRRRGLSTTSVESGVGANKVRPVPQPTTAVQILDPASAAPLPPAAPSTPPGSPIVDMKRLTLPSLPLLPPSASELPLGGPRTPSEPPSDDDDQRQDAKAKSVLLNRTQQPPLSAPASLPSPNRRCTVERFNASADSPENVRVS